MCRRQEMPEGIYSSRTQCQRFDGLGSTLRIHIEGALRRICKFLRQFFPLWSKFLPAFDDPLDMRGLMRTANVASGVSQSPQNGDHSRRALETRGLAGIFRLHLFANSFDQLRRNPAAWGFAFGHPFRGFQAKHIYVAE